MHYSYDVLYARNTRITAASWASVHWAAGRLTPRSREASKLRYSWLDFSNRFEFELPVKFQSGTIIITSNPAPKFHETWK